MLRSLLRGRSFRVGGVGRVEFAVKLVVYSALYGFLAVNYIDLVVPGSSVPGYHLWLVFQYFAPFIPILFALGFDDWEIVLSMGFLGSLMNDLGYYPAAMLFFGREVDLADWYMFQLGFRGFEARWIFNGGFFTFPVTSLVMGLSIYARAALTCLLAWKWWVEP
jgi:hypothetical protein